MRGRLDFDRIALTVALLYLLLPVMIFLCGWLKAGYAAAACLVLAGSFIMVIRDRGTGIAVLPRDSRHSWLVIALIALAWVSASGLGGFAFQNWDFEFRNATLHDLIDYRWPVIYDYTDATVAHRLSGHTGALVYYVTFWLPAALAGRLWGWKTANLFLFFYAYAGVVLCFYFFSRYIRRVSAYAVLLFVFFSGLDCIGKLMLGGALYPGQHLEWWAGYWEYPSHTTILFWVFQQAIPSWLVFFLVLSQTGSRNIVFLASLLFPFAPMPCLALAPFIMYKVLRGMNGVREVFSMRNISAAVLIAGVFGSYYVSNKVSLGQTGWIWARAGTQAEVLKIALRYAAFCLLEFGLIALALPRRFRRDPLFIIAVISLIAIPWLYAGRSNDFSMRASLPALALLSAYTARWLMEFPREKNGGFIRTVLVCCILLAAVTPANEIIRSVQRPGYRKWGVWTADEWKTFGKLRGIKLEMIDTFIAIDPGKTFFFRTLAKQ